MQKKLAGSYREEEYFQFRQADPAFSIILPEKRDIPIAIDNVTGTIYYARKNKVGRALSHKCLLLRMFLYEDDDSSECDLTEDIRGLDFYEGCLYAWTDSELACLKEGKIVHKDPASFVSKVKQGLMLHNDGTLKKGSSVISKGVKDFDSNGHTYAYLLRDGTIKTPLLEWNIPQAKSLCVIDEETVLVGTSDQVFLLTRTAIIDFGDPTNAYSGPEARYLFASVPGWGPNQPLHHLIIIANTHAADLSLIASTSENSNNSCDKWMILSPTADDALAQLPFSRDHGSKDQSPKQLIVDYTNSSLAPSPLADGAPLPPAPLLWVVTNEGTLCPFRLVNSACPSTLHPLMRPLEKEYSTEQLEEMKRLLKEQSEKNEKLLKMQSETNEKLEVLQSTDESESTVESNVIGCNEREANDPVIDMPSIIEVVTNENTLENNQKVDTEDKSKVGLVEPNEIKEVVSVEYAGSAELENQVDQLARKEKEIDEQEKKVEESETKIKELEKKIADLEKKAGAGAAQEQQQRQQKGESRTVKVDLEYQVRKEYTGYENNLSQTFIQLYLCIQQELELNLRKLQDLEAFTEKCRQHLIPSSTPSTNPINPNQATQLLNPLEEQVRAVQELKSECLAALITLKKNSGSMGSEERTFDELEGIMKDANLYTALGGKCKSILSLYQRAIKQKSNQFAHAITTDKEIAASITPLLQTKTAKESVPLRKLFSTATTTTSRSRKLSNSDESPTSLTIGFSTLSEELQVNPSPVSMTSMPPPKAATMEIKTISIELETESKIMPPNLSPLTAPSPISSSKSPMPSDTTLAKTEPTTTAATIADSNNSTFSKEEQDKKAVLSEPKVVLSEASNAKNSSGPEKKNAFDFSKLSFGITTAKDFPASTAANPFATTKPTASVKPGELNNASNADLQIKEAKEEPTKLAFGSPEKTTFTPFGSFNSKPPVNTESGTPATTANSTNFNSTFDSGFGAKAASLFPSTSPTAATNNSPFISKTNSTVGFGANSASMSFGTPSSFGMAFGQTSMPPVNPFLKSPTITTPRSSTGAFANTSTVNFAALANNNSTEQKDEDKKKDLPLSFTQFRG